MEDSPPTGTSAIAEFLAFVLAAKTQLAESRVANSHPDVQRIRDVVEEHYLDDRGQPAMYQQLESAIYDDAQEIVTLWGLFDGYPKSRLHAWRRLLQLEYDGLTGDRHPRKVFDRSPFGIGAIVIGTFTVWMTFLRNYSGEDLSDLLELVRFNWIAGTLWIGGLFVFLWFVLKTVRNNKQVALVGTLSRALQLYLLSCDSVGPARTVADDVSADDSAAPGQAA